MYAATLVLAREQGLDEVADILMRIAVDELRHAGLYAVLNGQANHDVFETIRKIQPIEETGVVRLNELASRLRLISEDAACVVESIVQDEGHHGERLLELIGK